MASANSSTNTTPQPAAGAAFAFESPERRASATGNANMNGNNPDATSKATPLSPKQGNSPAMAAVPEVPEAQVTSLPPATTNDIPAESRGTRSRRK